MFYSQDGQDQFLETNIFKGYKNGVYMDIGAYDGVDINNTLYFEKTHNWTGVNVEPMKESFDQLVINRPHSINLNCAVCNSDGETEFFNNTGHTKLLSGIKSTFDARHFQRLVIENFLYMSNTEIITVPTKRMETICDEHNISHINYLSIDVEGAEFEVISSINFDKVFIDVIGFENNYRDVSAPIVAYLNDKGYVVIHTAMDIFMIHENSSFYVK